MSETDKKFGDGAEARLMAAAPSLLAALETALPFIESKVAQQSAATRAITEVDVLLPMRAALAKARGEA